jgi:phosphatidylinositol glycan class O
MEDSRRRTEYVGIAAQYAKAKAELEQKQQRDSVNTSTSSPPASKIKEVQFKATHGLLLAFFTWNM